jgi:CubicO group peptidase (beta-lactamase class C family)
MAGLALAVSAMLIDGLLLDPRKGEALASTAGLSTGKRVVTQSSAPVRREASGGASLVGTQPPGKLGAIIAGPQQSGGQTWWKVDFKGGADGWTQASELQAAYFPPSESRGGWRSLVPYGGTPNASQKAAIRARAGVDWDKLKRAADYSRSFTSSSAVLVIRNGYVVGEWGTRSAQGLASISKSLTGLTMARMFDMSAAGRLNKRITPDSYAYPYLPSQWAGGSAAKRQIRVRHLMSMTPGLQPHDYPGANNYLNVLMNLPSQHSPGSRWAYASAPVDLLSLITKNVSGRKLRDLFNQQVAAPIGVPAIAWNDFHGSPNTGASSKAHMRARDLARIGHLMMMDGFWGGGSAQRSIVSAGRVRTLLNGCNCSGSTFQSTPGSPFRIGTDSHRYYGQLWWTNRTQSALGGKVPSDAFYAHGFMEKLLVVVPSQNLIVVRLGTAPKSQPSFKRELMSRVMDALVRPAGAQTAALDGLAGSGSQPIEITLAEPLEVRRPGASAARPG